MAKVQNRPKVRNIQFLIKTELKKAMQNFNAKAAGGLLMDVTNGEVLSLVSLPDYNINIRKSIKNKKYTNKITKNLYELGSVFKTFAVASALDDTTVKYMALQMSFISFNMMVALISFLALITISSTFISIKI